MKMEMLMIIVALMVMLIFVADNNDDYCYADDEPQFQSSS